jgi:hypothetical protein
MTAKSIILGVLATRILAFCFSGVSTVLTVVVVSLLREIYFGQFVAVEE